MTLSEYIDQDLPFFHIAHYTNKDSILKNGLSKKQNPQGICVVRSADIRIINMIAIGQLNTLENPSNRFCVFRINPSKHNLSVRDIRKDITYEFTNPLHNYIIKSPLTMDTDDIVIEDITIPDSAIPDFSALQTDLLNEGLIVELEYYPFI